MIVSPLGPNSSNCFMPPYRLPIPAARINNVGFSVIFKFELFFKTLWMAVRRMSEVNYLAVCIRGCFHRGLTHGGVRMNRLDDLVSGGFQFAGHHHLGDHFRYVRSDHVCSQPFAVLGVENNLYKAVGMAGRFRFTGSRKGKLPYLDLVTRLARRLFRITYRGDFWLAIGTSGDVVVVQRRRVFPGYFFHTDDA